MIGIFCRTDVLEKFVSQLPICKNRGKESAANAENHRDRIAESGKV